MPSPHRSLFTLLVALGWCACEPPAQSLNVREPVRIRAKQGASAPDGADPNRLKVMAWNIKFGAARIDFWFDYWGDRVEMSRDEVQANLAAIHALINEVAPDVLLVEEIEVNSRRSAYVDMVQSILDHTDLRYAAYVSTWDSRYIPSEGLGRINMGNAILSRYPITFAERIPLSDRSDLDALHATFYLHRALGRVVIQAGDREIAAYVVHTEAYDTDGTKSRQLDEIREHLGAERLPFVIGGDFNAIPPGSVKTSHFNDEHPSSIGTEFEQPPYDLEDMKPFYESYRPWVELSRYGTTEAEQRRYYTHSVIGPDTLGANGESGFWTRTLDYLFVSAPGQWVAGTTDVLQQSGDSGIQSNPLLLSDHAPVVGTWEVAP